MQKQDFEEIAKNYEEIHKRSLMNFSKFDFRYFIHYKIDIIKSLTLNEPAEILDFGCGTGGAAEYMRQLFPSSRITGIDSSKFSIEECVKRKIENSCFYNIDITRDETSSKYQNCAQLQKYDLITASCVFHHIDIENRKTALNKLIDALNLNGNLFIFEHNPYNPAVRWIFKNSEIDKGCFMESSLHLKKMILSLKRDDIKITSARYTIFMPRYKCLEKFFFLEKYFEKIPIGGQYYTVISKIKN